MECKFICGQKVVCITDLTARVRAYCPSFPYPIKDKVYTVSAIEAAADGVYISVAEVGIAVCACRMRRCENWWFHGHFKPLEHSGMSILREIAENPKPIPGELVPAPKKRKRENA